MVIFADVTISTETLAVFTAVVGTLWSSLVLMWRYQTQGCHQREKDHQQQISDLVRVMIERGLRDEIPHSVPRGRIPPRPED